jgi:3-hydroxyisobutyrate dehydrogenase
MAINKLFVLGSRTGYRTVSSSSYIERQSSRSGVYRSVAEFVWLRLGSRHFSASASVMKAEGTVGFIGLGNMGASMAKNLLKKNYPVIVYDLSLDAVKSLKEAGASSGNSPAEIASKVKTIVTMLPSSPHVRDVYSGKQGILNTVQPGTLMLDCSTIDPAVSQEIQALAAKKDSVFMDCPVSGGVVAARDAGLTFMVGGLVGDFERAKVILSHMGKNIVHCGPTGTGQAAKICNNMLLAISMIGTAEAMHLGKKLGLDPKMLAKVLNTSSGRCWSSEMYNPCPGVIEGIPSSNNYQGGFGSVLMVKDLGLAQNSATATQCPTPMGSLAHQIYRIMCNSGYGKRDFASVFLFLENMQKSS